MVHKKHKKGIKDLNVNFMKQGAYSIVQDMCNCLRKHTQVRYIIMSAYTHSLPIPHLIHKLTIPNVEVTCARAIKAVNMLSQCYYCV